MCTRFPHLSSIYAIKMMCTGTVQLVNFSFRFFALEGDTPIKSFRLYFFTHIIHTHTHTHFLYLHFPSLLLHYRSLYLDVPRIVPVNTVTTYSQWAKAKYTKTTFSLPEFLLKYIVCHEETNIIYNDNLWIEGPIQKLSVICHYNAAAITAVCMNSSKLITKEWIWITLHYWKPG